VTFEGHSGKQSKGSTYPDGALATVASDLHPLTFWRRVLFIRIRSRQLAHTELTQFTRRARNSRDRTIPSTVPETNPGGNP